LTIHKAKGLEFPVVIIPFLEMSIKAGSSDKDGGQSFVWEMEEEGTRLLRLKESYTRFAPELKARYIKEYKDAFFAELNNVYVALTRPVWEMYVLIPERVGNSPNPVPLLIPTDIYDCGKPVAPAKKHEQQQQRLFLPPMSYHPWITHLQEEFLGETANQMRSRIMGEMVHYCLSFIGNLNEAGVDEQIKNALKKTELRFGCELDAGRIKHLLGQSDWKTFFNLPKEALVLTEQEIVNTFGDTRRIDRLIILSKEVWVVDFKSSRIDEVNHRAQVKEYESLLAKLYPGKKITGHILYLDVAHE
jgi:ATP-dependent helicase/nuclease subunit A